MKNFILLFIMLIISAELIINSAFGLSGRETVIIVSVLLAVIPLYIWFKNRRQEKIIPVICSNPPDI